MHVVVTEEEGVSMNSTESLRSFASPVRTLPRNILRTRPRIPGLGFGFVSIHEGPPAGEHSAEMRLAEQMPQARRAEFRAGRWALRRALHDAGLAAGPVLRHGRRPALPAGISASVSHSGGMAVAVAGPAVAFPAVGIDLELGTIPQRAAHLVLRRSESALLAGPGERADRRLLALFSAKEAAYKAFGPLLEAVDGADALPGLRAVRLGRDADGFLAEADALPGVVLRVTVRHLSEGVLSWALAAPVTDSP